MHKYTAKLHLEDEGFILNEGNDVEELMTWMHEQAEVSSHNSNINGEIIENTSQDVIKRFQYNP